MIADSRFLVFSMTVFMSILIGTSGVATPTHSADSSEHVLEDFAMELLHFNKSTNFYKFNVVANVVAGVNECHADFVIPYFKGEVVDGTLHVFAVVEEREVEIDPPCPYTYDPQLKQIKAAVNFNASAYEEVIFHNIDAQENVLTLKTPDLMNMFGVVPDPVYEDVPPRYMELPRYEERRRRYVDPRCYRLLRILRPAYCRWW